MKRIYLRTAHHDMIYHDLDDVSRQQARCVFLLCFFKPYYIFCNICCFVHLQAKHDLMAQAEGAQASGDSVIGNGACSQVRKDKLACSGSSH